jgi:hypothetical protein
LNTEGDARIKALLEQKIDWAYLIQIADSHGVIPLLYKTFIKNFKEKIPEPIFKQLKKLYLYNAGHNLLLTNELFKILELFKKHRISAVPYRGPTLASFAYGSVSLRKFVDLDILIREQEVKKAKNLLMEFGYYPMIQLTGRKENAFIKSERTYKFSNNNSRICIELHWAITPRYFPSLVNFEFLEDRLKNVSIDGKQVLSLSQEDSLLAVCVHSLSHCWMRLGWVCDISQLINSRQEMNWELVLNTADRLRIERVVFLGLLLAKNLLGADIPQDIYKKITSDSTSALLAEHVRNYIFKEGDYNSKALECYFIQFKIWTRLRDRLRHRFHRAMAPTIFDWEFIALPTFLFPFYYFLRPIRLFKRYTINIFKYIFNRNRR